MGLQVVDKSTGLRRGLDTSEVVSMQLMTNYGVYNLKPANMRRWRRIKAGGLDGTVLNIGDSTTRGQAGGTNPTGTGSNVTPNGEHAGSYPVQLASMLATGGLAASKANFCGAGAYSTLAKLALADPRLVIPADWINTNFSMGGATLQSPNTVTTTLEFTPVESFDTIDVYYVGSSSSGTMAVSVDGGAALDTFATTNATAGLYKRTISCVLGTHTLKIVRTAGGAIYVAAVILRNSTAQSINVINAGWQGTAASHWANPSPAWGAYQAISVFDPDLTVINLGINDVGLGTSISSFTTNMTSIITAARAGGGDVVLIKFVESNNTTRPLATQQLYWDVIVSLADTYDCPLVMAADRVGSWEDANADGFMYDDFHPRAAGYADMARAVANALLTA